MNIQALKLIPNFENSANPRDLAIMTFCVLDFVRGTLDEGCYDGDTVLPPDVPSEEVEWSCTMMARERFMIHHAMGIASPEDCFTDGWQRVFIMLTNQLYKECPAYLEGFIKSDYAMVSTARDFMSKYIGEHYL